FCKFGSLLQGVVSLFKVDNRNTVAIIENKLLRLWIETAKLVTEMDACIEEVFRCNIHICLDPGFPGNARKRRGLGFYVFCGSSHPATPCHRKKRKTKTSVTTPCKPEMSKSTLISRNDHTTLLSLTPHEFALPQR